MYLSEFIRKGSEYFKVIHLRLIRNHNGEL